MASGVERSDPVVLSPLDALGGARAVYAGYLALQAVGGVVLWLLIDGSSFVRSGFEIVPARHNVTNAFFLADVVVIATSAASAWGLRAAKPWALAAAAFTAGGVVYPTAYLVQWAASNDGGAAPALVVMLVVSALTLWVLQGAWRLERAGRAPSS